MLSDWLLNACNRSESPLRQKEEKKKGTGGGNQHRDTQRQFLATDRISIILYHISLVFLFFSWNKVQFVQVLGCHHHMSPHPRKNWDLTTQWAKVMEAIKPRRGRLGLKDSDVGDGWSLYVPLNNLNNRHGTSSRRNCWMLFVNDNMACGTWCSVLLCTIYI